MLHIRAQPAYVAKVLIVDDQGAIRTALDLLFQLHGLETLQATNPKAALELIADDDVGVVVQDMNFGKDQTSGEEGIELFHAIRKLAPDVPILLMTAWTSLETAVQLVKDGAADYLAKPWDDQKLVLSVQNLMRIHELDRENLRLRAHTARGLRELKARANLCDLVYESDAMQALVSLAVKIAPANVPVLIRGPNGSGKERIANIVQANSRRRDGPFVKVNAGGLPDELLEAELFGAEAGAFTGATKMRVGRFEAADGGTLFLDEIGNLSSSGQMKLLRVLQSGEFERLGSSQTRKVDVRIISATNADLPRAIQEGRFREDLFYRLNVVELMVPPLCERPDDILPLAECFLKERAESPVTFDAGARVALVQHDWPGNVRELENRVQRALLVAGSVITAGDLGLSEARSEKEPTPPEAGTSVEREHIEQALQRAQGVVSRAAAELGMSRQALYRRMDRLGISLERRLKFGE